VHKKYVHQNIRVETEPTKPKSIITAFSSCEGFKVKTILLMRHAKSSWKDKNIKDRKRPLGKRGKRNAPQMGELIKEKELIPQIILSSSAERAKQTSELFSKGSGFQGETKYIDSLFMAEADEYIKALRALPDDIERVMVIGHNPGLESLLPLWTGQIEALPTSAIAYLVAPIQHWGDLNKDSKLDLVEIWRPKELGKD
jgi:phosphohistidine phosphatase